MKYTPDILDRKHVLELFLQQHSHLCNMDKIFVDEMKFVLGDLLSIPTGNVDVDELVGQKLDYSADVTMPNQSFTIPWMTPMGTFVVNGVEKVPLIQEVKARNIVYISSITDEKSTYTVATTRFPSARFPVRLVVNAREIYLDVSVISRQLDDDEDLGEIYAKDQYKATTKISFGKLMNMFNSGIDHVMDTLKEMEDSNTTLSMLFSCLQSTDMKTIPHKDTLVENLFNVSELVHDADMLDDIIMNTLLYMLNQSVLVYMGKKDASDRDDYSNKMFKSSGNLIGSIVSNVISHNSSNYAKMLDTRLMSMMRTGNMSIGKKVYPKMVVQVSKRSTFDILSSVRKIVIPCDENSAGIAMRQIHPSQNGFVCLSETPEGKTTGLIKSMALTCVVSPRLDTEKILQRVLSWTKSHRKKMEVVTPSDEMFPTIHCTTPDVSLDMLQPDHDVMSDTTKLSCITTSFTSRSPSPTNTVSPMSGNVSPILTRQHYNTHASPIAQRRHLFQTELDASSGDESVGMDLEDVNMKLLEVGNISYYDNTKYIRSWILFDGIIIGYVFSNRDNDDTFQQFRSYIKRKYMYVSVSNPYKYIIEVRTWIGRPMRPLLVVPDTSPVDWRYICTKSWKQLVKNGMVEYLDPSETNMVEDMIADMSYNGDFTRFKYMEIHPCTLFGIPASLVPFANHNQTARNIFATSMVKQAMQLLENPPLYQEGKYLVYGQRPLVDTITSDAIGLNNNPNGINIVVCVLAYTGYNMEDAIIVNKKSVDNGLFMSMVRNVYNRISDGIAVHDDENVLLLEGDVEKKVSKMKLTNKQHQFNGVTITRDTSPTIVMDDNRIFVKDDDYRKLSIGDKIASRHAQKGVIGRIMDNADMPFNENGIVPDIIFNPHGIPSRMTMGQLLEGIVGTQCAIDGTFFDGTPFNQNLDMDAILDMEQSNSCMLFSGMSGEQIDGVHHLGTIYYMPLKHQSKDKVYVRWTGPNELFSRQPVAGKKKGGGLKFGEMEMDAMVSHGAANAIIDTIRQSDMCYVMACTICGLFPSTEDICTCGSDEFVEIEMPYSLKVFSDLSKCANMSVRLHDK